MVSTSEFSTSDDMEVVSCGLPLVAFAASDLRVREKVLGGSAITKDMPAIVRG